MEEVLPNSLTRVPKVDWAHSRGVTWFYLFCASCGADGGRVIDTMLPDQYAFYLCNNCADKYGESAVFIKTPDDVFWSKIQEAMIENYGHYLTEEEVLQALSERHGALSKLEREGKKVI